MLEAEKQSVEKPFTMKTCFKVLGWAKLKDGSLYDATYLMCNTSLKKLYCLVLENENSTI